MHDIEQQPSQDDAKVTLTDLPRQEERQVVRDADTTPLVRAPKRPRQPFAMRYLVAGGILLLVLAVIFSIVLVRNQLSSQPGTGATPAQHQPLSSPSPTATPMSSSDGSSQFVHITIANGVAYVGGDAAVYALRTDNRTLLWRSRIEGAVGDRPVVADGVVYVTASTDIKATLYALRESDGTQLWHSTSNGPEISTPIVANGVVYIGTQANKVLALRAGNGTLLWQYSDSEVGLLSPQLVDGVVYVNANDERPGNVYALQASDGRLLWHYKTGASLNGITVLDGVAYVTSQDGVLTALNTSDGHQRWQRALGGGTIATMWQPIQALYGVLYVATTKMSVPTASTSSPGLLPQALAMSSFFLGNFQAMPAAQTMPHKEGLSALFAIRASDGTVLWHFDMNNGKNGMVGWLSLVDGVIYTSVMDFSTPDTSRGHIYALQSTTGTVLWHYDDNHASPSAAVLTNGIIYVSAYSQDRNDVVYALRARDGSVFWRQSIGQPVYDTPVLNGATVYIGAGDGSVYALQANNGAVEWHRGG